MGKKVLIIDDTKNIRLLLTKCLELEGYEVTTAANGKEGLEQIHAGKYDLIFLDIKLPEMSGTEVLRRMRSANLQTPVIIITAYPTIKNAVECTRLGVVSYLQKPFTAERLKNVLAELEESGVMSQAVSLETAKNALEAGDGIQALSLLGRALSTDPKNPEIYTFMAKAYEMIGDMENAAKFRDVARIFENHL